MGVQASESLLTKLVFLFYNNFIFVYFAIGNIEMIQFGDMPLKKKKERVWTEL